MLKWPRGHLTKFTHRAGFHSRRSLTWLLSLVTGSSSPCWKPFPLFICSFWYYYTALTNPMDSTLWFTLCFLDPKEQVWSFLHWDKSQTLKTTKVSSHSVLFSSCLSGCPLPCLTKKLRRKSSCCTVARKKHKTRSGTQRRLSLSDSQDTPLSWGLLECPSTSCCFFQSPFLGSSLAVPLKADVLKPSALRDSPCILSHCDLTIPMANDFHIRIFSPMSEHVSEPQTTCLTALLEDLSAQLS